MNKFFCIFCIIVFLFKTETVFSNNSIYDVNNIEVSGVINKDLNNKELIEKAFEKAFSIFINKTLLSEDVIKIDKTKSEVIKDLIFTYQIIKVEKINKNGNVLTLNVKFDPKKINSFLAKKQISYADISNISLTILPILVEGNDTFIYSNNYFYNNWIKKDAEIINSKLITYSLALENIEDLQYINNNKENLALIDIKKITSLQSANNYAFLIIYSTDDKLRAYIKTFIANKQIDKNIDLEIDLKNKRLYKKAIVLLKDEVDQIWKGQNLIDVNTPSFLDFFLNIKDTADYLKFRSVLDSIDIIENYFVLEMTNKYTKIRIKYKGKISKIKNKILNQNVDLKIDDNIWILIIK